MGFTDIRLRFDLDRPAPGPTRDALLAKTERYCVVYQTLARPPSLTASAPS